MTEKGFFLCDDQYYYCTTTNTLINGDLKNIYLKYCQDRVVEKESFAINADSAKASLTNLKQIIFEICQKCNLKCDYCIYESGDYPHFRTGSAKSLDLNTAQRSLEQIWQVIGKRDKKNLTLGFFGGESLLYFSVIEGIVDYAKTLFSGWKLSFTITTNGTLLYDRIIHYLIENDFLTHVSLDGPAENHDAKRVFRNGNGTYQVVIENLQRICSINKGYFDSNVFIAIVYSKDLSFEKMFNFFQEETLFKNSNLKLGFVTESESTYYERNPYNLQKYQAEFQKAFQAVLKKNNDLVELSAIESLMLNNFNGFFTRLGKNGFNSLMGACFYDSRLYVDADGGFHMCEKINDSFQFGSASSGFDYSKMAAITQDYLNLLDNCRECDVQYLCQKCYIHFAKKGDFKMNEEYCARARHKIKGMLEDWIRIQENGVTT